MFLSDSTPDSILSAVDNLTIGEDETLLVLLGEENRPDLDELRSRLLERDLSFAGAFFPGLLHGSDQHKSGAILSVLPTRISPILVEKLDGGVDGLDAQLMRLEIPRDREVTAFVIVDGLSAGISPLLAALNNRLGNSVNYFGGGAGSLSLEQQACLFGNSGIARDAALIILVDRASSLGIKHGWQRLIGPFVATRTRRNVIVELNWRPAFEVYREIVEEDAGQSFANEDFFTLAKNYPFGMQRKSAEDIVRDPVAVNEEQGLVCVGDVPENSVLHILKGESDNLILAAAAAAEESSRSGIANPEIWVADCISRSIFLEDEFTDELRAVSGAFASGARNDALSGMLTLGEISSHGQGSLEFFNKTIVVGGLHVE